MTVQTASKRSNECGPRQILAVTRKLTRRSRSTRSSTLHPSKCQNSHPKIWQFSAESGISMSYAMLIVRPPAVAVAAQGGNEAEKLFRQMENKIASAKALRVVVE